MQAVSLLNILSPTTTAGAALQGATPALGFSLIDMLLPNTETPLGNGEKSPDLTILLDNPQGDTAISPQINGIAALLAQQVPTEIPLVQLASNDEVKDEVRSDVLDLSGINSIKIHLGSKAVANEIKNDGEIAPVYQEKFSSRFNMGSAESLQKDTAQEKFSLASLSTKDITHIPLTEAAKIAQEYLGKRFDNTNNLISAEKPKAKAEKNISENSATTAAPVNSLDLSARPIIAAQSAPKDFENLQEFKKQSVEAIDIHETPSKPIISSAHHAEPKLHIEHAPKQSLVDQVQVKISKALNEGLEKIHIALHPAELGSVDVSMNIDENGNAKLHIVAEKESTLKMLRADSHELIKALDSSGITADNNGLEFSLRGGDHQQKGQDFTDMFGNRGNSNSTVASEKAAKANIIESTYLIGAGVGGINILA